MIVDLDRVAAAIAEIAETEIASRFGRLKDEHIDTKTGPNDFVTEADHAAEAALEKALKGIYPGAGFIGEESVAADPSLVHALEGDGVFWIVDPLDGTRNFVEGHSEYGSIVALVENGETRAGWIQAIPDHAAAIASKGDGATWRGDKLSPLAAKEGALVGHRAIGNLAEPWKGTIVPRLRAGFETEAVRCSAYGYINMARGRRDFALYSRCSPWDHAAGVLILEEICGKAEYLDDGAPYAPRMTQGRPMLAAGNTVNWARVRDELAA